MTRISSGSSTAGAITRPSRHGGASAELIGASPPTDAASSRIAAPVSTRLSHSRGVSRSPKKTSAMISSGTMPDMKIGTAVGRDSLLRATICRLSPPRTRASPIRNTQLLRIVQIMCTMRLPRRTAIRSAASLNTANPR
ncbi:hypothetical protein BJF79_15755 [Actinomadura sp. CNU-125]|nr:hypothetical protein [Actinomadura sp. CNU-125]OLT20820.1 hypothetical protein BJF79_15755 [Actinomadura sp. CNU-125]